MSSPYGSSKKPKPRSHARPAPSAPKPSQTPSEKTEGYQREFRHPSSREWTRIVSNVLAAHNGICHLCNHPGAKQADHVIPYAENQDDSMANLRPAHGVAGKQDNRCPVCHLACNNIRGSLSVEAGRRKIAARQGLQPPPGQDTGRDW